MRYVRVSLLGSPHHRYEVRTNTGGLIGWVKHTPVGWVWRTADGIYWHHGGSRRQDAEDGLLGEVRHSSAA